jgi:hypothetical protein
MSRDHDATDAGSSLLCYKLGKELIERIESREIAHRSLVTRNGDMILIEFFNWGRVSMFSSSARLPKWI